MKTRSELLKMRADLYDRLATETHRVGNPQHDEQLNNVARVLAGLQAINIVIEYDLDPRADPEPTIGGL